MTVYNYISNNNHIVSAIIPNLNNNISIQNNSHNISNFSYSSRFNINAVLRGIAYETNLHLGIITMECKNKAIITSSRYAVLNDYLNNSINELSNNILNDLFIIENDN